MEKKESPEGERAVKLVILLPSEKWVPHDHIQSFLVEFVFNEKDKEG